MREYLQPKRSSWFLGPKYLQNTPMPYKPVFLKRNHFTRFFFCRFNLASVSRQSPGKRSFSDETWHLDFCVPSSPNSRALFFQTSREVALKLRPWVHIVIDMEIKESCVYLFLRTMATRSFEVQNTRRSRQLCSPSRELHEFLLGFFWLLTSFQKCPYIQWWPGDHFLKNGKTSKFIAGLQIWSNLSEFKNRAVSVSNRQIRRRWVHGRPCILRGPLHQILPWRPALEVQIQPVANSETTAKHTFQL